MGSTLAGHSYFSRGCPSRHPAETLCPHVWGPRGRMPSGHENTSHPVVPLALSLWNTRRSVPRTRKWAGEAGRLKRLPATMGGPKSRVLKSCHRTQDLISDFPISAPQPSEVSKECHVGGDKEDKTMTGALYNFSFVSNFLNGLWMLLLALPRCEVLHPFPDVHILMTTRHWMRNHPIPTFQERKLKPE